MGAYDETKICKLVGIFLSNKVSSIYYKDNVGIYRDNGLAIFKNKNGQ